MNQTIKEWYATTYPEDTDMFQALHPTATFQDLFSRLDTYKDVYPLCADDSIVRERVFARLAELMEADYIYIYNQWLRADHEERRAPMECQRRLEDFTLEELNTDTCRHECYCEMDGGCPLFALYTELERTQRYETLCEEMGLEPYLAD